MLKGQALAIAYASADVFCLPSATETFGQVVLEAAASGLPAVVLASGGASELVVPGVTGLVAPDSGPGLEAALAELIDDPRRRERMGDAARLAALEWPSWDQAFDTLYEGYRTLTGPGRDTSWPAMAWERTG